MGNGLDTHVARSRTFAGLLSCLVTRHGRREQSVACHPEPAKMAVRADCCGQRRERGEIHGASVHAVKPSLRPDQYEKPAWNPKS